MNDKNIIRLVFAALFAALCCGATAILKFPTAMGYVNAGDAVVLLSAFFLGPWWGCAAAGLGSALADLLAGYAIYAPGTFVIKALMALLAGMLLRRFSGKKPVLTSILSSCAGEIVMVLGYLLYEDFILGYGAAALGGVPFNLLQGVFGAAAGTALFLALSKIPYVRQTFGR